MTAPQTVTIPDVELCRVGNWASALSGRVPIGQPDIDDMAKAALDPEVDHAPIKIGHVDPRFDGEPALGWLTNIRVVGDRVISDLADVPAKLAPLVKTAFKRRSVEIAWGVKTPSGKTYRAALAGLALLGVTPPAVKGLADVLARYSGPSNEADARGEVTIVDGGDDDLAVLHAVALNAQSAYDARRLFLSAHSGDLPTERPDSVRDAVHPTPEGHMTDDEVRAKLGLPADVPVTDQLRTIADSQAKVEADAKAKADEAKAKADADAKAEADRKAAEAAAAGQEPPTMTVDKAAFEALQAKAGQGEEALRILNDQERERVLTAALSAGRIAPASVDQYRKLYDSNAEQTKALLAGLPQVFSTVTNFSGTSTNEAGKQVDEFGKTEDDWAAFGASLMRGN